MKRLVFPVVAAVLLFTSCATHYVVTDNVTRRLDGTRIVLSSDTISLSNTPYGLWQRTDLDQPQMFDFRTERDTMRYAYSQAMPRGGWSIVNDSLSRMLKPQVTVCKHFRWFTTRYRYTAVFPALDSLPVPISQYLTDEEQRLLFRPLDLPADWNGADMYTLLDNLNTKYVQWWSHCFFEKQYELYLAHFDSTQRALLAQYHDTLLTLVQADLDKNGQTSLHAYACLFPELEFIDHPLALKVQEAVSDWYDANCELEHRVLWRVELPGGRSAEYMVSTERLIMGDYSVTLDSSLPNWWAIVLTLLFAATLVCLLPSQARRWV